jgi:UDP-N-acetylglucosamine 2-epimerase (non-hydrolysing)
MRRLGVEPPFALLTLHRPSNVDDQATFRRILAALERIGGEVPILFPAHPRTVKMMQRFGVASDHAGGRGLRVIAPLGYLDFLHLQTRAALILTDSGGVQEEATILGVPCLTLRENTERPVTITHGTNRLVGSDTALIVREALRALRHRPRRRRPVPLWDGRAAVRIAAILASPARRRS